MAPHAIMRWVRTESSWTADINRSLGTEPHQAAEPRTRENTGTCWHCWRNIKRAPDGRLVHHGFQRPGDGQIHGDCLGVGTVPYEVGQDAGRDALRGWTIDRDRERETLARFRSGAVEEIRVPGLKRDIIYRPSHLEGWAERAEGHLRWVGDGRWAELVQSRVLQHELREADAALQVRLYDHALRTWHVRPLPGEPGAPALEYADLRRLQAELVADR